MPSDLPMVEKSLVHPSAMHASADGGAWISDLLSLTRGSKSDGTPVSDGVIEQMTLPANWFKGRELNNVIGNSSYREFCPPSSMDSSTRIQFYERGIPLPVDNAAAFRDLLSRDDRRLNSEEVKALGSVLSNKKDPQDFRVDNGWTETINGRRVLMIEGEFLANQKKSLAMIVDKDGTGSNVQEVSLLSDSKNYPKLKPQFEDSIRSTKWR